MRVRNRVTSSKIPDFEIEGAAFEVGGKSTKVPGSLPEPKEAMS